MFYRLVFAHLVADFVLQTRWLVLRKRRLDGLLIHTGLVGLAMLLVAWSALDRWWPWLALITLVHGLADWAKIRLEPCLSWPPIVPFVLDQLVHLLAIGLAVAAAVPAGLRADLAAGGSFWWIACVYLTATWALSIALPLWLDPPAVMRRPFLQRLLLIVPSALVLTLAWRGQPLLIPVIALGLYGWLARRASRRNLLDTLPAELLSALMVAAALGWELS